jgi:hypothetical protein
MLSLLTGLLLFLVASADASQPAPTGGHSREFWQAIEKAKFTPPPDADLPALVRELTAMLASPDPELRDEIAYSTLTAWIYQQKRLDAAAVGSLATSLAANLRVEVGSVGSDAVFRRSFSALMLSVVVARDNGDPVLSESSYRGLLDAALAYLAAEKDVRGYDDSKGWIHSAAHTADLLKFLGRSRYLQPADATRILDGIALKLSASPILVYGEDERFARAASAIVNRMDFDRQGFAAWADRSKPAPVRDARPTAGQLQAAQNVKNFFSKFDVLLSVDPPPSDAVRAARDSVRAALKDAF